MLGFLEEEKEKKFAVENHLSTKEKYYLPINYLQNLLIKINMLHNT